MGYNLRMSWRVEKKIGETYSLANGLIRVGSNVTATRSLSNGAVVTMHLTYEESLGRAIVDSLSISRVAADSELHTSLLHEVHITDALQTIVLNHMVEVVKPPSKRLRVASDALGSYAPAKGRDKLEVLQDAATIYTVATVANLPPLKTVSEELDISHRTATRRISEARSRGMLAGSTSSRARGMTIAEADAWLKTRVEAPHG